MKIRKYMGHLIHRIDFSNEGLRWEAFTAQGRKRADTLDGIKRLIREAVQSEGIFGPHKGRTR